MSLQWQQELAVVKLDWPHLITIAQNSLLDAKILKISLIQAEL